MGDADDRNLVESTRDEHRGCMQVVADVEADLDRPLDRDGGWIRNLREKLPQLHATLKAHFESEQKGPMFRKVPLDHPRLADRLRKLETEHATILASVEDVQRRVEALNDPESHDLHEINAHAQMLIARIQRHEAEENEVLMEAHWSEVGAGD